METIIVDCDRQAAKQLEEECRQMGGIHPVSYTHLDVYKRQENNLFKKLLFRRKLI